MHPHLPIKSPSLRPIPMLAVAAIGAVIAGVSLQVAAAYGWVGRSRRVHVLGGSMEIALAFAQRIRPDGLGLCLQLGIRVDGAPELTADPDSDLNGTALAHFQFPFVRAGVSWR